VKLLRTLVIAGLLLGASPLAAAEPVKVTADTMQVDDAAHNATFSGSVVITRGSLTVWADKVVVLYGSAGQTDMESLTATGNVRIKTRDQEATGGEALFDPDAQILRLTRNVTVLSADGSRVSGPELTINLASNTTTFSGSESGRVTGVFTPQ
jgi:lipopolysaccharide export system protein LptA